MQSGVKTSVIGRGGVKVLGLVVLGMGLVLGGCNNKLKDENQALRDENAQIKQQVEATAAEKAALQQQMQMLQSENARLATIQTQQPPVAPPTDSWNGGGGGGGGADRPIIREPRARTIEISSDVLFAPGSATLKAESRRELGRYLSRLRSASSITIEGHTDSDPIRRSRWGSNQALSKARADAVRDYLVSQGVSRSKIDTVGKGSSEPKATKAQSRRVDIVVVE
jgi:outer membrane protein OmpA-like peptidoglycan-associated protein